MFIGRQRELKRLNQMYQSGRLEAAVIYGRRRVGKTTLISEFCKDQRTVFFAAQENSARQNLEELSEAVGAVGQWWGRHPQTHRQAQIDVVVTAADEDCGIAGSCKFKNRLVSEEELNLLEDYAKAMGAFARNYYYLFSKSGFTELLKRRAAETGVRLVTLDEMYYGFDGEKMRS